MAQRMADCRPEPCNAREKEERRARRRNNNNEHEEPKSTVSSSCATATSPTFYLLLSSASSTSEELRGERGRARRGRKQSLTASAAAFLLVSLLLLCLFPLSDPIEHNDERYHIISPSPSTLERKGESLYNGNTRNENIEKCTTTRNETPWRRREKTRERKLG